MILPLSFVLGNPVSVSDTYGWRITGALLVGILTLIVGQTVNSRVRRALASTSLGANPSILMARAARAGVYFLGIIWILAICSVPFTALAAIVSVTALALSLSLQDLLKSLIAGIYLLAERPFHIGDRITVGGVTGIVDDIQMRATFLHSDQGERIVMPNQTVFTQVIVNNTVAGGRLVPLTLELPKSVGTPDQVRTRITDAARKIVGDQSPTPPVVDALGATAETTRWRLVVWLPAGRLPDDAVGVLLDAIPEAALEIGTGAS